ncbi:MAG: endonuclease/exonuclease/phosphatase family metal-dependent hydrolase [Myxococcota bacterium]|jgi:endonuclease/exonuclease/phosphatase family metal-dependent hydrolase
MILDAKSDDHYNQRGLFGPNDSDVVGGSHLQGTHGHTAAVRLLVVASLWSMAPTPAAAERLTVLTLNLRSHYDQRDRRLVAIASFLARVRPDVVFLQEVARDRHGNDADRLAYPAGYAVAHEHNSHTRRGLAILSRHPIRDVVAIELPGKRRLAIAAVVEREGRLFSLVNLHLTPQLDAAKRRTRELRRILTLARNLPGPTLVAGDFNFGDAGDENRLLSSGQDVYRARWPNAAGHTWDLANPLARRNSYPDEPSRRLDRIIVLNAEVTVLSVDIVLDDASAGGLYPSDHYGLLAEIEVWPDRVARPEGVGPVRRSANSGGCENHHPVD